MRDNPALAVAMMMLAVIVILLVVAVCQLDDSLEELQDRVEKLEERKEVGMAHSDKVDGRTCIELEEGRCTDCKWHGPGDPSVGIFGECISPLVGEEGSLDVDMPDDEWVELGTKTKCKWWEGVQVAVCDLHGDYVPEWDRECPTCILEREGEWEEQYKRNVERMTAKAIEESKRRCR